MNPCALNVRCIVIVSLVNPIISPAVLSELNAALKVLSYGSNSYKNNISIHAERKAIDNLPVIKNNRKRLTNINILVIRTTKNGDACMSKPCEHCINDMLTIPQRRGYVVKNVYYSDENGEVASTTLGRLLSAGNFHVSKLYRTKNHVQHIMH